MGADLITCALAHETDTELDFDAGRELLSSTDLEDFPEEPFHWIEEPEDLRDVYLNAIDIVEGALVGGGFYRTHNDYTLRGVTIHIIGGTTWGDSPGDLFDSANAITYWPELQETIGFLTDWSEDG